MLPIILAFGLAVYTQFTDLLMVPGLHFDEAWQGLYAHRIATEQGFWPITAMNGYTTPVVHYLLAAVFKVFGPTLASMRGFYALLNLSSLALFLGLFVRIGYKRAAFWFALFWALLPLSVHIHRFHIEMTGFHGLCLAGVAWAVALWNSRPRLAPVVLSLSFLAGTYSHVIFVALLFTAILVGPLLDGFFSKRSLLTLAFNATAIVPLAISMHQDLAKKSSAAFVLVLLFIGVSSCVASARPEAVSAGTIRRICVWTLRVCFAIAIPFSLHFVGLLWNGFWAYAQVTGEISKPWLAFNAFLFVGLLIRAFRYNENDRPTDLLWAAFLAVFVVSSLMMLKQTARYYTVAMIFGMACCSLLLAQIRNRRLEIALISIFVAWNLFAFHAYYLAPFQARAGTNEIFRFGFFKDSARDFRPFQKAFRWASARGCAHNLRFVEDDRFLRPVEFMLLSEPPSEKPCPWPQGELYFGHTPRSLDERMKTTFKFVHSEPSWGDLSFWELIKK